MPLLDQSLSPRLFQKPRGGGVCERGVSDTSRASSQCTERPDKELDTLRLESDPVEDNEPVGEGVLCGRSKGEVAGVVPEYTIGIGWMTCPALS